MPLTVTQFKADLMPVALNPTLNFYWYDTEVDVSDVSLNERIFITTDTTPLQLTHVSGTVFKASNYFNILDVAYNDGEDVDSDKFYTSYLNNYQAYTGTSESSDLSVNIVDISTNTELMSINTDVYANNDLVFDLSGFAALSNSANLTRQYVVNLDTCLNYLSVANTTGNESTVALNIAYFPYERGLQTPTIPKMYVGDTGVTFDLSFAVLNPDATITFTTDTAGNQSKLGIFPYPSILFSQMLSAITNISFGYNDTSVNVSIPNNYDISESLQNIPDSLHSGSWSVNMTLVDGEFTQTIPLYLPVYPQFTTPVINFSPSVFDISNGNHDTETTFIINYDYNSNNKANVDLLEQASHLLFKATLVDALDNEFLSNEFLSLDISVNNLPPIATSDTSRNFVITYNGDGYKIENDDDYYVRISYKTIDAVSWTDVSHAITVERPYTTALTPTNNYDGTYSVPNMTLYENDKIQIVNVSTGTIIDAVFDVNSNKYMLNGDNNETYYVCVVDASDNIYPDTKSIEFTFKYLNTTLSLTNNYNGTFTVSGIPPLDFDDKIFIQDTSTNTYTELSGDTVAFTSASSHEVAIWETNDSVRTNKYTISVPTIQMVHYGQTLSYSDNYDGTFTINFTNSENISNHTIKYYTSADTTPIDITDEMQINGEQDVTFTVSVYDGSNAYTSDVNQSLTFISRHVTVSLSLINNYDGTFNVSGVPNELYGFTVGYTMDDGNVNTLNSPYTIVKPTSNVPLTVALYTGENMYTHTSDTTIPLYTSTQLTLINNYDGTFDVSGVPSLAQNHTVHVIIADTGSEFEYRNSVNVQLNLLANITSNYTNITLPSHGTMYIGIVAENNVLYINTKTSNVVTNDYAKLALTFNIDGLSVGYTGNDLGTNGNGFAISDSSSNINPYTNTDSYRFVTDTTKILTTVMNKPQWFVDISDDYTIEYTFTENEIEISNDILSGGVRTNNVIVYDGVPSTTDPSLNINFTGTATYGANIGMMARVRYNDMVIAANYFNIQYVPEKNDFYGNRYNNVIVLNNKTITLTQDGTNNVYRVDTNIANLWSNVVNNNTWCVKLDRSTFMTSNAYQDIAIDGTGHTVNGDDITVAIPIGNNPNLVTYDISLALGFFTGYIDIDYYDTFRSIKSVNPNKVRLIVLPTPDLVYTFRDLSLNTLNLARDGYVTHAVYNRQLDNNSNIVTFDSAVNYYTIDGVFESAQSLIDQHTTLTWNARSIDPHNDKISVYSGALADTNTTTVAYNTAITGILQIDSIDYDQSENHVIVYQGDISFNRLVKLAIAGQTLTNSIIHASATMSVTFYNDSDLSYATSYNVLLLNVDNAINIDNMGFVYYFRVTSDVNLNTNTAYIYPFVILENETLVSVTVTANMANGASNYNLPFATRAVFARLQDTLGNYVWHVMKTESVASYSTLIAE